MNYCPMDYVFKHTLEILSIGMQISKGLEKNRARVRNYLFLDTSENTEYEVQKICTIIYQQ
jgi:hypothetical protein